MDEHQEMDIESSESNHRSCGNNSNGHYGDCKRGNTNDSLLRIKELFSDLVNPFLASFGLPMCFIAVFLYVCLLVWIAVYNNGLACLGFYGFLVTFSVLCAYYNPQQRV